MSAINSKAHFPRVGDIAPQSAAASSTKSTAWVKADSHAHFIAQVNLGALGGGAVALAFEQANTSGGGGAKAVSGAPSTSSSTDNANFEEDFNPDLLDKNNGFFWFRANLVTTGGSGSQVSLILNGANPRYAA